ncbi:RING-H2 finger protein ATL79-like [Canna indica]|uniref:RING-H2 finger protein ATL79-like n=1 Tax=Canna indica TaxID=4628 RepID=A0AAQ3Q540_9LILI|nr:RING-H2 finger protein ATL79-like [Canna indica]
MPDPHADSGGELPRPAPAAASESTGNATANKWGPYSGAGDFGANMAIVLAALFGVAVLGFSLGAAVRVLLRRRRCLRADTDQKPEKEAAALPTMVFSAAEAGTRLAGAGAPECAICLTEFVEGDAVSVLPACSHGFHVRCVEQWLAERSSCPTCRACCRTHEEQKQPAAAEAESAQVGAEAV